MVVIPAIDIIDGRCVRLVQGDFSRTTVYNGDPADVARQFADAGCTRLHVVDLDGAREGRLVNGRTIERIVRAVPLAVDVGGGIRSYSDVAAVFDCGAHYATVGSVAVYRRAEFLSWMQQWGAEAFILGVDVLNGRIAVHGWREQADDSADAVLSDCARAGLRRAICTDIARDGMLQGISETWYSALQQQYPSVEMIASGGVASLRDIELLACAGVRGVVVGRALYEGQLSLRELQAWNSKKENAAW